MTIKVLVSNRAMQIWVPQSSLVYSDRCMWPSVLLADRETLAPLSIIFFLEVAEARVEGKGGARGCIGRELPCASRHGTFTSIFECCGGCKYQPTNFQCFWPTRSPLSLLLTPSISSLEAPWFPATPFCLFAQVWGLPPHCHESIPSFFRPKESKKQPWRHADSLFQCYLLSHSLYHSFTGRTIRDPYSSFLSHPPFGCEQWQLYLRMSFYLP